MDELIAVTGHHCKHGIRLLGQTDGDGEKPPTVKGRRVYHEAVREAVIVAWEGTDRICGKRLKAALPHLVESMEHHGHLDLDLQVRERLLAASAATLDRLLKPIRTTVSGRRKRRRNLSPGRNIPVRTFADWNRPPPGFLEIELVAHRSDNMGGSFTFILVATNVCTGWTEAVPLLDREQSLLGPGGGADHGAFVRGDASVCELFPALVQAHGEGPEQVRRAQTFRPPATPCDRLMRHEAVSTEARTRLSERRTALDPVALLHTIREAQSALTSLTVPELRPTPHGESLEQFLASLPDLWRRDETHYPRERKMKAARTWRTREDPFAGVWCDVLVWLRKEPDANAVALLGRLQSAHPDRYSQAHLRTMQRRVQQWRAIMAKKLVYASGGETCQWRNQGVAGIGPGLWALGHQGPACPHVLPGQRPHHQIQQPVVENV